jgi:hypothetical protein
VENELAAMVLSYLDDPEVTLVPDDPGREHLLNTWRYGVPAGGVVVDAVVTALVAVGDELRRRFASGVGPAVFYAWYDEQAGQLRCSLTSRPTTALPFGSRYRLTDDPRAVVTLASANPSPGLVPWTELTDAFGDESEEAPRESFPVWAVAVR